MVFGGLKLWCLDTRFNSTLNFQEYFEPKILL